MSIIFAEQALKLEPSSSRMGLTKLGLNPHAQPDNGATWSNFHPNAIHQPTHIYYLLPNTFSPPFSHAPWFWTLHFNSFFYLFFISFSLLGKNYNAFFGEQEWWVWQSNKSNSSSACSLCLLNIHFNSVSSGICSSAQAQTLKYARLEIQPDLLLAERRSRRCVLIMLILWHQSVKVGWKFSYV